MPRYQFITMDQPVGRFYITTINSNEVIPISQSNVRNPYNHTGIQRKLNQKKVNTIAEYCKKGTAMFPTPIILSGESKYFKFYNHKNEEYDEEINNLKNGFVEIDKEAIIKDGKFLSIVDGQHRLRGIEKSGKESLFDLLVIFIFDTEASQDAEIFSTINKNQTQVSSSLVYDLYGLSDEPSVEKFAHEIVKEMNSSKYSILMDKIKMLGYKIDSFDDKGDKITQNVSQGAIVNKLLDMLSSDKVSDNNALSKGREMDLLLGKKYVLRKYLVNDQLYLAKIHLVSFFNAWEHILRKLEFNDTIMFKTVGFLTALEVFKVIYYKYEFNELDNELEMPIIESNSRLEDLYDSSEVCRLTEKYLENLKELDFNGLKKSVIENSISSSESGANRAKIF